MTGIAAILRLDRHPALYLDAKAVTRTGLARECQRPGMIARPPSRATYLLLAGLNVIFR
jgi:hypothetical protein